LPIRHFAERGYSAARVEDIAGQLGIAKGSVFQHFKSKDGLFFEAYKKAVQSFPKYMQTPAAVQERGFFELLRYWLARTENMVRDNWSSYRIYLNWQLRDGPSAAARDQSLSGGGGSLRMA